MLNTPLIATATVRGLRVTPQKARRVVNLIRGIRADEAINIVKFAPQIAVSEDVYTLLNSAVANAKQKNPAIRDASELWVTEALVEEGQTMKRFRPRAQGRGFQILKRSSQISVVLSDDKNYRRPSKESVRKAAKAAAGAGEGVTE
ncbi:50S ribosomal protein L22 [Actinomycetes bacterium]|nr:50S ribosomal protein L22 [Actinomycetes bacterium]